MNKIHQRIKELKKSKSFEHKNIFIDTSEIHTKGLKIPHKTYKLDRAVLKGILKSKSKYLEVPVKTSKGIQLLYLEQVQIDPEILTSSEQRDNKIKEILHYQGCADSDTPSAVSISITEDTLIGLISDETGSTNISQINDTESYVISHEDSLTESNPFVCAQDTSGTLLTASEPQALTQKCVQLYWEVRNQVCASNGGLNNTISFITAIFNQVQLVYANHGLAVNLKTLKIWDTPDPYGSTNSNGLLQEFGMKSSYVLNQTGNKRGYGDLAVLIGYNYGGIAWTGVLDSPSPTARMAYCGINSTYSSAPVYSWTVDVLCHEMGHLYGSPHTHEYVWNCDPITHVCHQIDGCGTGCTNLPPNGEKATLMSYGHLCSCGKKLEFHPEGLALIQYYVDHAVNLGTITTTDPVIVTPPPIVPVPPVPPPVSSTPVVDICPYPNPKVITCSITVRTSDIYVNRAGYTNYKYTWYDNGVKMAYTTQVLAKTKLTKGHRYHCIVGSTNSQTPTNCHQDGICFIDFN